ncbi:hypothetical protein YC2023_019807 [Brassica napus]
MITTCATKRVRHITTKAESHKSMRFKYVLEESGDFGVFRSLLSAKLHRRVSCLDMDGDLSTVRLI